MKILIEELRQDYEVIILDIDKTMGKTKVKACHKLSDARTFFWIEKKDETYVMVDNCWNKYTYDFPSAVITRLVKRPIEEHENDFLEKVNKTIAKMSESFKRFFEKYNDIEEDYTWDDYYVHNIHECLEILKEKKSDLVEVKYPK